MLAHWRVAALLDRLDRTWDPPRFLDTVERLVLLIVGVLASLILVTGVQALFRKRLARSLRSVPARQQVLVFVVPVLACLVASWRFRVMLAGPLLLLALNLVQYLRNMPPSTPATQALGWVGRTGVRVGRVSAKAAGKGAAAARKRLDRPDEERPPF